MQNIQMVDLKGQYQKIKAQVDSEIQKVIDSTGFINGEIVHTFSRNLENYLGVKHVVPCANGTDALQIAMMALGLKPGDEVICPSFTYIATVEVLGLLGMKPVFCEVHKDTFCIDVKSVESLITDKTKAIVPVHLYGQSADMEPLLALAKKHNLFVVEDTAQAIGGSYTFSDGRKAMNGTMGDIGTTSFFPSKNLGAYGDGGALYTHDDDLAQKARMIANHGQRVRYIHDRVGCNSRLDSIQAAILNVKLPYLDTYCTARRKVADFYNAVFAGHPNIVTPRCIDHSYHVYHQYTLVLDGVDRNKMQDELQKEGIPSMIYYPIPSHKQKMFKEILDEDIHLEVTDWLTERVISLPVHTEMTEDELNYISRTFLEKIELCK